MPWLVTQYLPEPFPRSLTVKQVADWPAYLPLDSLSLTPRAPGDGRRLGLVQRRQRDGRAEQVLDAEQRVGARSR